VTTRTDLLAEGKEGNIWKEGRREGRRGMDQAEL
jgi:hypothetical protein